MDIQKNIETIVLAFIGIVCIAISILDFIGALDSILWISGRISIMTLLTLGSISLYLVIERNRRFKKIEISIDKTRDEILSCIRPGEIENQIISEIKNLWAEREDDIQNFFNQIGSQHTIKDHATLKKFLQEAVEKFYHGDTLTKAQKVPWDYTIAAMTLKGNYIYHISKSKISLKANYGFPYSEVVAQKNGHLFWLNYRKSEQLNALIPDGKFRNSRFTKIYFRHFEKLQAIVSFESHINILYQLPRAGFKEY